MLSHSYAHLGAYAFALSLTRGLRVEAGLRLCSFLPVIYHAADQALPLPAFLAGGSLQQGLRPGRHLRPPSRSGARRHRAGARGSLRAAHRVRGLLVRLRATHEIGGLLIRLRTAHHLRSLPASGSAHVRTPFPFQ